MKKLCLIALTVLGMSGMHLNGACYPLNCPVNPNPYYNGYCPTSQNQDSAVITFNINPFDYIELHDHSIEFSNCVFAVPPCNGVAPTTPCTCVTSSFSAATNAASCQTPKKLVGQLDAPMPCCTLFAVQLSTPVYSCYNQSCNEFQSYISCQEPGTFCGVNQCLQNLSKADPINPSVGIAKDLITCITCPFSDCDIGITYFFCADVCARPGSFQRTFTLSFMDQAADYCYGTNGCPTP